MTMQQEVDAEGSEKARVEGNASFKKGKWSEAIGHYTTAVLKNPEDPAGYTNRAAAYLKLEKYEDADRDCSKAIELQPENLKALYRRSIARKNLGRFEEALKDIDTVCKLDKGNTTAIEERREIRELLDAYQKVRGEGFESEPIRPEGGVNPQMVLEDH